MAIELVKSKLLFSESPTSMIPWSGNYKKNGGNQLKRLEAPLVKFSTQLKSAYKLDNVLDDDEYEDEPKIKNIGNSLPLTGGIMERVGARGLMHAALYVLKNR